MIRRSRKRMATISTGRNSTKARSIRSITANPSAGGADQLILDENVLAKGKEYFRLGRAVDQPRWHV